MLEHRGRKTGKLRRTVLEVVANPPDALYVAAAWAAESDWLKNIEANPQVMVHCGFERFRTDAQVIEEDVARSVLADYAEQHSGAFRRLACFMLADPALTVAENIDRVASTIPFVKLPRPVAGG
ncbi:MAG: nitroreductase family deazaflavin-dependent oxidoreductase [Acidimicrobiia bacterium]